MCSSAAELYGGCLEDWGVGWEAAGYDDEDDFLGSCSTWAWEMQVLEDDAVERGEAVGGEVAAICAERRALLDAEDATCQTYTDLEWGAPW
jgi:hypothetical protein